MALKRDLWILPRMGRKDDKSHWHRTKARGLGTVGIGKVR